MPTYRLEALITNPDSYQEDRIEEQVRNLFGSDYARRVLAVTCFEVSG
jgi:hypothetical protein